MGVVFHRTVKEDKFSDQAHFLEKNDVPVPEYIGPDFRLP